MMESKLLADPSEKAKFIIKRIQPPCVTKNEQAYSKRKRLGKKVLKGFSSRYSLLKTDVYRDGSTVLETTTGGDTVLTAVE